jgi:Zn-finger domain-containing protein
VLSNRSGYQYSGDVEAAKMMLFGDGATIDEVVEILKPVEDGKRAMDRERKEGARAFIRKIGGSGSRKKLFSVIGVDKRRRYKTFHSLTLDELEKLHIEVNSVANLYDNREAQVGNRCRQIKTQIEMELRQRRLPFEEQVTHGN